VSTEAVPRTVLRGNWWCKEEPACYCKHVLKFLPCLLLVSQYKAFRLLWGCAVGRNLWEHMGIEVWV